VTGILVIKEIMGESVVEAPNIDSKMGESVASRAALEVSISFGRFENDSLSWEKWSSFSPNKYLEEVEKFSTPGSVAQKKAYFEAHYKKIAAQKAELQDQESSVETNHSSSDGPNCKDRSGSTSSTDAEPSISNGQSDAEEVEQDTGSISMVSSTHVDEPEQTEDPAITFESENSLAEEAKEALNYILNGNEPVGSEEAALVEERTILQKSIDTVEQIPIVDKETANDRGGKEENPKFDALAIPPKIIPSKKEHDLAGTKKKKPVSVSPIPKSQHVSTPRSSKPISTSTVMSASRSSTKKASVPSLQRSKILSLGESKRAAPTSLHMSLSLGPSRSDSASHTTTRKSLIMESMGDKDIVKRAFKAFSNNLNQLRSSSDEVSSGPKQVPTRGSKQKVSGLIASRKENERSRKVDDKVSAQRGQLGTRWSSISSGSPKAAAVFDRNVKAAPSSIGLRSDERAERRREISKRGEEKSSAKVVEKSLLGSKTKLTQGEKEAEMKKLRQSLNFKAKPMPDFYRGQGKTKGPLDKEVAKNEIHRRPELHR
ncbi:hypothetical protein RJ639_027292, partial [Escallonia herrerae]